MCLTHLYTCTCVLFGLEKEGVHYTQNFELVGSWKLTRVRWDGFKFGPGIGIVHSTNYSVLIFQFLDFRL